MIENSSSYAFNEINVEHCEEIGRFSEDEGAFRQYELIFLVSHCVVRVVVKAQKIKEMAPVYNKFRNRILGLSSLIVMARSSVEIPFILMIK